jgi:tRNA(His) guanylyltransferase
VTGDEFESAQRAREWFHALTVPPGMWMIIRVDGRSFSRFTADRFSKPFDPKFSELTVDAAKTLLTELGARYAYTESDEISVLVPQAADVFGRSLEKLVSISAFTHACGEVVCLDRHGHGRRCQLFRMASGGRGAVRAEWLVLLDVAQCREDRR